MSLEHPTEGEVAGAAVRVPPRGDDPDVWPFNDAGYQDAKDRVVARDAGREYLTVDEKWQLASRDGWD